MDLTLLKELIGDMKFSHVFFAVLSEDQSLAEDVSTFLKDRGAYCWSGQIPGGSDPSLERRRALNDADFVLVFANANFAETEGWHLSALKNAISISEERINRKAYLICLSSDGKYPRSLHHLELVNLKDKKSILKFREAIFVEFKRRQEKNFWPVRKKSENFTARWDYPEA